MPHINVAEDTFHRLTRRAAALRISVEQLVAPLLDAAIPEEANGNAASPPADPPDAEWKHGFDAWMAAVQTRADRYPPGFVLDDGREGMYEGCGE